MQNFNQIYADNYKTILQYVNFKVSNFHDAEDITSEVFTKVFRFLNTYDHEKSTLNSWLHNIANNAIIDFYRKTNQSKSLTTSVSDFLDKNGNEIIWIADHSYSGTDDRVKSADLKEQINRAFDSLKPKNKRIAILFFMEQKEYKEIAEICNVPMGTVKGMISRCREKLQAELKTVKAVA